MYINGVSDELEFESQINKIEKKQPEKNETTESKTNKRIGKLENRIV